MKRYNPKEIEPRWQKIWAESGIYKADMKRADDKSFVIPMLPYPSGDLHIGHWYNFGPTDTVARFRRMLGRNVLTTIGFDAFGLPAENAAIKRGIQPAKWTYSNIESMTKQIGQIGASYDWDHTLTTSRPDFYKWNQWLFLKLYEKKMAYRAKRQVNWCPKDQTVLANEQVVGEDNVCERCGTPVIQKELEQWFYKITDYADRLLDGLDTVDWPQKVRTMQQNWIGKSKGALIKFKVDGSDESIEVFTTRPDTIFGSTYMVLAPEHPLVGKITSEECRPRVEQYIEETGRKTELERKEGEKHKTGSFTGAYAVNPATKDKIPVWIADYVLAGYGTGAIMAVPGHDNRDYEFARKFDLPVKFVIEPTFGEPQGNDVQSEKIFVALRNPAKDKVLVLNWGPRQKNYGGYMMIGGSVEKGEDHRQAAEREIREETGYTDFRFVKEAEFKGHGYFYSNTKDMNVHASGKGLLFDLISEKRADTDLDHGEKDKFTVSWENIDRVAGMLDDGVHEAMYRYLVLDEPYTGEGLLVNSGKFDGLDSAAAREKMASEFGKTKTNYKLRDWLISRQRYWGTPIPIIYCDKCGVRTVPEKDLPVILPEDVEFELSGRSPLQDRPDFVNTKCPDCGGDARRETDTMDTFVDSSWYFLRYIDANNDKAAYDTELVNKWGPVDHYIGGIEHAILHLMYARFLVKFLHEYHGLAFEEPFKKLTNQGIILGPDGQKMSKSRGNVVNPDEQVNSYGADSLRLYLMFMGPYEQGGPYDMSGIAGTRRFLDRFWTLVQEYLDEVDSRQSTVNSQQDLQIISAAHKTVKKVTQDLETLGFNTAIAAMMSLVNDLYKFKAEGGTSRSDGWRFTLETLTQLLAPFAPHITEEIWEMLGHETSVHVSAWPQWDEKLVAKEVITLAVQINGKVRSEIAVNADISEEDAIAAAKSDRNIAPHIMGKTVKKAIYVPGRLVSIVL